MKHTQIPSNMNHLYKSSVTIVGVVVSFFDTNIDFIAPGSKSYQFYSLIQKLIAFCISCKI